MRCHHPRGGGGTKDGQRLLEKSGALDATICTALGVAVLQTGGGGATTLIIQRASNLSWGTRYALAVHRPTHDVDHVSQWLGVSDQQLADVAGHRLVWCLAPPCPVIA
jgi:hypothetical protein